MRKLSREICFDLIFEILTRNESEINQETLSLLCEQENLLVQEDIDFVKNIVNTFLMNKEEILQSIYARVTAFSPERIYKADLALIALGLCEVKYAGTTDKKIVINEIVELAKKFSSENSPKFCNGVLSALLKE